MDALPCGDHLFYFKKVTKRLYIEYYVSNVPNEDRSVEEE